MNPCIIDISHSQMAATAEHMLNHPGMRKLPRRKHHARCPSNLFLLPSPLPRTHPKNDPYPDHTCTTGQQGKTAGNVPVRREKIPEIFLKIYCQRISTHPICLSYCFYFLWPEIVPKIQTPRCSLWRSISLCEYKTKNPPVEIVPQADFIITLQRSRPSYRPCGGSFPQHSLLSGLHHDRHFPDKPCPSSDAWTPHGWDANALPQLRQPQA